MAYWIAAHVPAWITGVVLIVGLPLATVAIQVMLRRAVPALKQTEHNEVAGFLVAVIGVAYAVVAGFTIIVLWENFTEAQRATNVEALRATPLEQGSQVFGPATQARLRREIIAYDQSVIDNWSSLKQGNASPQVRANLDAMLTTIESLEPTTDAQRAFVDEAEARLLDLSNERRDRIITAHEGELPPLMWIAILVASAITIMFALLFGLENARLHYVMVAGLAAIIGTNLFLVAELNFPFAGDISVQPTSYRTVVQELESGQ
jgi:Protein of unknown function (DUF4239)